MDMDVLTVWAAIGGSVVAMLGMMGVAFRFFWGRMNRRLEEQLQKCEAENVRLEAKLDLWMGKVLALEAGSSELPYADWAVDMHGKCTRINTMFVRLLLIPLGKSREDIIGKSVRECWSESVSEQIRQLDERAKSRASGFASAVIQFDPRLPMFRVYKYVWKSSGEGPLELRGVAHLIEDV